jgi:hypothetical protein
MSLQKKTPETTALIFETLKSKAREIIMSGHEERPISARKSVTTK